MQWDEVVECGVAKCWGAAMWGLCDLVHAIARKHRPRRTAAVSSTLPRVLWEVPRGVGSSLGRIFQNVHRQIAERKESACQNAI